MLSWAWTFLVPALVAGLNASTDSCFALRLPSLLCAENGSPFQDILDAQIESWGVGVHNNLCPRKGHWR
jgi:hypothetical protein